MTSAAILDYVQLGNNADPTKNLVIQTNKDGTFKIARGNISATTQDLLTIDANGRIALPQTVVVFDAYATANQSVTSGAATKVGYGTEVIDTANCFDLANGRFQPPVSGYYQFSTRVRFGGGTTPIGWAAIYKNGGLLLRTIELQTASGSTVAAPTPPIYMNGSTDYVEMWASVSATSPVIDTAGDTTGLYGARFSGFLIGKA